MGKPCRRCRKEVVHPDREYLICLDCLIDLLAEEGVIAVSRFKEAKKNEEG